MSHEATNWAIKQRGLKPAVKLVLWHLCDRFHPDYGCFPSQATLADDCELPRSTLNVHLSELEKAGLIRREQRRQIGSKKQESTRYRFPFEADFPCPETGHGSVEPVSRNDEKPCPENGQSRVQNLDSNLVIEPVREPVSERGQARDDLEESEQAASQPVEDVKQIERMFWSLVKDWPQFAGMGKERPLKAWMALTADERELAVARYDSWRAMLKANKKCHVPGPEKYFREKLWLDAPDAPAVPVSENVGAGPWGKLWMATRLADLLRKPYGVVSPLSNFERLQVQAGTRSQADILREKFLKTGWTKANRMMDKAEQRSGYSCPTALEPHASSFQPVHRDSDVYAAWVAEHERRGWPWTSAQPQEYVYFPALPDGLPLDEAVAAAVDGFAAGIADFLQKGQGDA